MHFRELPWRNILYFGECIACDYRMRTKSGMNGYAAAMRAAPAAFIGIFLYYFYFRFQSKEVAFDVSFVLLPMTSSHVSPTAVLLSEPKMCIRVTKNAAGNAILFTLSTPRVLTFFRQCNFIRLVYAHYKLFLLNAIHIKIKKISILHKIYIFIWKIISLLKCYIFFFKTRYYSICRKIFLIYHSIFKYFIYKHERLDKWCRTEYPHMRAISFANPH